MDSQNPTNGIDDPSKGSIELAEYALPVNDSEWTTWPGTGLRGRDFGLVDASGGQLSGYHVQAMETEVQNGEWHCYDLDFEFAYGIACELALRQIDGTIQSMKSGRSFCHSQYFWHRDVFRSGDLEVVRLISPTDEQRFESPTATLPAHVSHRFGPPAGVYVHCTPLGPSSSEPGSRVLDLGAAALTNGRFDLQLRQIGSRGGGDVGYSTSAQWTYVVDGSAEVGLGGPPSSVSAGCCFGSPSIDPRPLTVSAGGLTVLELDTGPTALDAADQRRSCDCKVRSAGGDVAIDAAESLSVSSGAAHFGRRQDHQNGANPDRVVRA